MVLFEPDSAMGCNANENGNNRKKKKCASEMIRLHNSLKSILIIIMRIIELPEAFMKMYDVRVCDREQP